MSYETRNDNLFYRFRNSKSMETPHPIVLTKRQKTWDFNNHSRDAENLFKKPFCFGYISYNYKKLSKQKVS